MNDRNTTTKKTWPFRAKFPEQSKTKALTHSASYNGQQQRLANHLGTEQSIPPKYHLCLEKFLTPIAKC